MRLFENLKMKLLTMKDEMSRWVRTAAGIEAESPHPDTPKKAGGEDL